MSRPLSEFELHAMPLRDLVLLAEERGIRKTRKDLLIRAILDGQDSTRWWNAMRNLRTLERYERMRDDYILLNVAMDSGKDLEGLRVEDLEGSFERLSGEGRCEPSVPAVLTRSELVSEIGKHPGFEGLTPLQVERRVSGGIPSIARLGKALKDLGGPSSSSPERDWYDMIGAVARLKTTGRFRGATDAELGQIFRGEIGNPSVISVARGFDFWERGPEERERPQGNPSGGFEELRKREEYGNLSDQEIVERLEESLGGRPVEVSDLEAVLGRGAKSPAPEGALPRKDRRWWDAMRKIKSLRWPKWVRNKDVLRFVSEQAGVPEEEIKASDLLEVFGSGRAHRSRGYAEAPHDLTRSEVLAELAKFPRYEGMSAAEIEGRNVPATTKALKGRLRDLGGPSSSSPETPGGWWDSMRKLRTLVEFQEMEDDGIVEMAREPTVRGLEELFSAKRTGPSTRTAKVPRRLSREEILAELAKMPRYQGAPLPEEGLEGLLKVLGGPSSSDPLGRRARPPR